MFRLQVHRLSADRFQFSLSFHHAILDGWCLPLLWREVLAFYRAHTGGPRAELADVRPYREYVAWLSRQDLGEAETYWRKDPWLLPNPLAPARNISSSR